MYAVGHCMSKALSFVWGVWRGGEPFDAAQGCRREKTTSTRRRHLSGSQDAEAIAAINGLR